MMVQSYRRRIHSLCYSSLLLLRHLVLLILVYRIGTSYLSLSLHIIIFFNSSTKFTNDLKDERAQCEVFNNPNMHMGHNKNNAGLGATPIFFLRAAWLSTWLHVIREHEI